MKEDLNEYKETDLEVEQYASRTFFYIINGDDFLRPKNPKGLFIYGLVQMLRINDDFFHGEDNPLTSLQRVRLGIVETVLDKAVERRLQFYPFGHNRSMYELDEGTRSELDSTSAGNAQAPQQMRVHSSKGKKHITRPWQQ